MPSPALMIGIRKFRARTYGAPELGWRTTIQSAPRACKVLPVSTSDSPFSILEAEELTSEVCVPSNLAANSNETRVRVEGS
jgi:hypothetical protein